MYDTINQLKQGSNDLFFWADQVSVPSDFTYFTCLVQQPKHKPVNLDTKKTIFFTEVIFNRSCDVKTRRQHFILLEDILANWQVLGHPENLFYSKSNKFRMCCLISPSVIYALGL